MLVVMKVEDVTHAAEIGLLTTMCGIPLVRPAIPDALLDLVTHEECLELIAKKRIWGHQE